MGKRNFIGLLFFLIILSLLFVVSSSENLDNVKSYDEETKTITIKDGSGDYIADITLMTEKHRLVFPESHAAEIEIDNYKDNINFYQDMELYEKDKPYTEVLGKSVENLFTYKYYDPHYEIVEEMESTTCETTDKIVNETINETICTTTKYDVTRYGAWLDFDVTKELPKGKIKIRMYYPVKEGQTIEWIPTLFGERITEWAEFTGATLYEYYEGQYATNSFSIGSAGRITVCQGFKVGVAGPNEDFNLVGVSMQLKRNTDGNSMHINLTKSLADNQPMETEPALSENLNADTTGVSTTTFDWHNFSMSSVTLEADTNYSLCIHDIEGVVEWAMNDITYGPGVYPGGRIAFYTTSWINDDRDLVFQIWGTTNLPPYIELKAPENNAELTPGSIEFVYNVSDPDNDDVDNCSLWLNENQTGFVLDQTDDSITQIINQSFTKSLGIANYTWKIGCYDNNTNQGNSTVYNLTIFGVNVAPTIDVPVILPEPAYTDSILNCSVKAYDVNLDSLTIKFDWYNGTSLYGSENKTTTNGTFVSSLLNPGIQAKNEVWNCTVRAFDGADYSDYESVNKSILNSIPTHTTPLLNSTTVYNATNEDLTCYNQNTADADNDVITNIYSWFVDNNPFSVLNLPFEINADDYSGSNNDGTVYGSPDFVSGKYGEGLEFDGAGDYIFIPDSDSLDFVNKKTFEFWFKRDVTGVETLFSKGDSNYNYKLEFLSNNKLKFLYSLVLGFYDYLWNVNTESDFNLGSYNQTYYNTTNNAAMLSGYSGDYKSKVYNNSAKTLSFNQISYSADIPAITEELSAESGMVGLWHMNNNWNDATENNNDGTSYGDASFTTNSKLGSHAGEFDGDGDYLDTLTNNFPVSNEDITVEAWFKIDDLNSDNSILTYGLNAGHKAIQLFYRTSDDKLVLHYWGGYGPASVSLNDNDWHHAVGVHANNTNYLYLDGEFVDSTSYGSANIANSFSNIGRVVGYSSYDFDGIIDEVVVWNRSLSEAEISEHYNKGVGVLTNLSFSVRSCSLNDCSDKGISWDISEIVSSPYDVSSLTNNTYFQFKAEFLTNDTLYSPELYNVTLNYSAQITENEASLTSSTAITDSDWHFASVTFDSSVSENNFKIYLDNSVDAQKTEYDLPYYKNNNLTIAKYFNGVLDEFKIYDRALSSNELSEHYNLNYNKIVSDETSEDEVWKCKITPNDATIDGTQLESNTVTVMPNIWDITFNITEGEYGNDLTGVQIACDNGWSTTNTQTNPYGPIKFYEGSYSCEFEKINYYNKTTTFTSDSDKQVDIVMSLKQQLTIQEHNWLEAIYLCLYEGDCKALDLLEQINETTENLWDQFKPTDETVVLDEDIISNELSSTQNISIDYTIRVPPKAGYSDGDWLPIRIAYWFLDTNNESCKDQDKVTIDTNRAEKSYCIPLIAETLGRINENTTFTVDLRPNLEEGSYTVIRDIEIDPNQIWIKYGQEELGEFDILDSNSDADIFLVKSETGIVQEETTGATAETSEPIYVAGLTGDTIKNTVEDVKRLLSGSQIVSIIAMIFSLLAIVVICFTVYKIKVGNK